MISMCSTVEHSLLAKGSGALKNGLKPMLVARYSAFSALMGTSTVFCRPSNSMRIMARASG